MSVRMEDNAKADVCVRMEANAEADVCENAD